MSAEHMTDLGTRCDGTPLTLRDLRAALRKIRHLSEDNAHTAAHRVLVADILAHPELTTAIDRIQAAQSARRSMTEEEENERREIRKAAKAIALGLFGSRVRDMIDRAL